MTKQKGLPQIVWKAAQVRNGKAVGAVPKEGELILVIHEHGEYEIGSFGYGGPDFCGLVRLAHWASITVWASLPPLDLDDDGNVKGLPF